MSLLSADLERKRTHYVRIDNFVNKYLKITFQLGTLYIYSFRLGQYAYFGGNSLLRILAYCLYLPLEFLVTTLTGIKINPATPVAQGLVIHNFSCIFIDAQKIGENCTVNQCVSIGAGYEGKGKPVLGDNVFVGSGAKILGDVTVGDNVVVASNALVLKSVPDNCTVAGVPARVISRNKTSEYLQFNKDDREKNG